MQYYIVELVKEIDHGTMTIVHAILLYIIFGLLTFATIAGILEKITIKIVPLILISIIFRLILIFLFVNVTHYDTGSYKIIGDATLNGFNIYPDQALGHHPYLPFLLYIEGLSVFLAQSGLPYMFFMKVFFSFFDVMNILLLYVLSNRNDKIAFLYAINPTFVFISAVHGQIDEIPITCILLALYLLQKKEALSGLVLGLGIMVKTWPLLLLVIFVKYAKQKILFIFLAFVFPVLCIVLYSLFFHASIPDILSVSLSYRGSVAWGSGPILWGMLQYPEKIKILITDFFSTDIIVILIILSFVFFLKNIKKEITFFLLVFSVVSVRGTNPCWLLPFMLLVQPRFWHVWTVACGLYWGFTIQHEVLNPLQLPLHSVVNQIASGISIFLWGFEVVIVLSYTKKILMFITKQYQTFRNVFKV